MSERLEVGSGGPNSKLATMLASTSISSSNSSTKKSLIQVVSDQSVENTDKTNTQSVTSKASGPKKITLVEDDSSDSDNEPSLDDLDDIDVPPPIHDSIHDSIHQALKGADGKEDAMSKNQPPAPPPEKEGPSLMEEMMKEAEEERKKKEEIERKKEAKRAKKFGGGLKGGFFSKKSGDKKKKKKKEPAVETSEKKKADEAEEVYELSPTGELIPTITKPKEPKKSSLVFDEVQAALGSDPANLLNQTKDQWATQSLTDKIMKNPRLAMGMSNPRFLQAIADMKRDPEGAKKKYKGVKEIEDFLREFMGVMGEHFTEMGEKEKKKEGKQSQQQQQPQQMGPDLGPLAKEALERQKAREARGEVGWDEDAASKKKVDEIVNDSQISSILMDPEMQKVLQECALPGRMGKYMNDAVWGPKIRMLIDKGLIKVEK